MNNHLEVFKKLKTNPKNPRKITKENLDKLKKSILNFPEMLEKRPIVYDENHIILGGNMRFQAINQLVQESKFEIKESYFVSASDWSEEKKREFVIRDNIELGDWDMDILTSEFSDLALDEFGLDLNAEENPYSKKIESPHYEITGAKPTISDLVDAKKYDELKLKIDNSNIPEDIKLFLLLASCRHLVFNYENIAEYYAHSEKEVQKLMEDNALVIIDFDSAIENGYVQLTEKFSEIFDEDYNIKNE